MNYHYQSLFSKNLSTSTSQSFSFNLSKRTFTLISVLCDDCGIVPVPKADLPVLLPDDVTFDKIGNPLDHHKKWQTVNCPKCNKPAKRETQTFDTFVDSSWYALRYPAPKSKEPIDKQTFSLEHCSN